MSTRGLIGKVNSDNSITYIYVHHDSYVGGGVGEILFNHYTDENKINKLLALGDMSSLGTEPVENKDGWKLGSNDKYNMCVIYRTRGEDCPATTVSNLNEYMHAQDDAEYLYLFDNNQWFVYDCYDDEDRGWQLVEDVLEEERYA